MRSKPAKVDNESYDAPQKKFRMDFERADMSGSYARMDLFKTRSGQQEMTDAISFDPPPRFHHSRICAK